jgi:hypothetical protein
MIFIRVRALPMHYATRVYMLAGKLYLLVGDKKISFN